MLIGQFNFEFTSDDNKRTAGAQCPLGNHFSTENWRSKTFNDILDICIIDEPHINATYIAEQGGGNYIAETHGHNSSSIDNFITPNMLPENKIGFYTIPKLTDHPTVKVDGSTNTAVQSIEPETYPDPENSTGDIRSIEIYCTPYDISIPYGFKRPDSTTDSYTHMKALTISEFGIDKNYVIRNSKLFVHHLVYQHIKSEPSSIFIVQTVSNPNQLINRNDSPPEYTFAQSGTQSFSRPGWLAETDMYTCNIRKDPLIAPVVASHSTRGPLIPPTYSHAVGSTGNAAVALDNMHSEVLSTKFGSTEPRLDRTDISSLVRFINRSKSSDQGLQTSQLTGYDDSQNGKYLQKTADNRADQLYRVMHPKPLMTDDAFPLPSFSKVVKLRVHAEGYISDFRQRDLWISQRAWHKELTNIDIADISHDSDHKSPNLAVNTSINEAMASAYGDGLTKSGDKNAGISRSC